MAVTLKEVEAIPATYPPTLPYAHTNHWEPLPEDAHVEPALIWQRIEAYTRFRWTPRQVVWTVEGEGFWEAPLEPATVLTVEVWERGAWTDCTPGPSPWGGYDLPGDGPYRITADVGGGDVPEAVAEAFRRLHEYSRGIAESWRNSAAYRQSGDTEIMAGWTGRALQLSGAADLLRA